MVRGAIYRRFEKLVVVVIFTWVLEDGIFRTHLSDGSGVFLVIHLHYQLPTGLSL